MNKLRTALLPTRQTGANQKMSRGRKLGGRNLSAFCCSCIQPCLSAKGRQISQRFRCWALLQICGIGRVHTRLHMDASMCARTSTHSLVHTCGWCTHCCVWLHTGACTGMPACTHMYTPANVCAYMHMCIGISVCALLPVHVHVPLHVHGCACVPARMDVMHAYIPACVTVCKHSGCSPDAGGAAR